MGSIPALGAWIPPATGQLCQWRGNYASDGATMPVTRQLCRCAETLEPMPQKWRVCAPQGKIPHDTTKMQHSQITNKYIFFLGRKAHPNVHQPHMHCHPHIPRDSRRQLKSSLWPWNPYLYFFLHCQQKSSSWVNQNPGFSTCCSFWVIFFQCVSTALLCLEMSMRASRGCGPWPGLRNVSSFSVNSYYWTKLGSAHPCTAKPVYWHKVVMEVKVAQLCPHGL